MPDQEDRRTLYIGRSGERAVLSELLSRGYNAATPEIDIGEDIFVIEDGKANYWPVQVKTAIAEELEDGSCRVQFNFRRDQLVTPSALELTYILALRRNKKWSSFLIIQRSILNEYYENGELGTQKGDKLTWAFIYDASKTRCQKVDFSRFESNWEELWPDLFS